MNLLYRRVTYITFIIIFLILAPLIVLYAQGYRFNLKRGKIQKTGILIVSSAPRAAAIYLNGKLVEKKDTPARIERLLPGDYEIKLTKNGYHDWNKKLPIYDNGTTFAEKIILWKNTLPIPLAAQNIVDWQLSPDGKKIIFINNREEINLLNLENDEIRQIKKLDGDNELKIIAWSNSSRKIIIEAKNNQPPLRKFYVFEVEKSDSEPAVLNANILPAIEQNLKWDWQSDNTIYSLNSQGLWQMDLFRKKYKLLLRATSTQDFLIAGNEAYLYKNKSIYRQPLGDYLSAENASAALNINLGKIASPVLIAENIRCDDCSFINKSADKLFLFGSSSQNLFIVDPQNKNSIIKTSAKDISWLNKNIALFYNDWEIWIYDLNKKEPELITRLGQPITKVVWHPEGKHIIFATSENISVIELDNRELRNAVTLTAIKDIKNLEVNGNGRDLYFTGKLGEQENIFKLNIR
ncbi:MAG: PEGA domain-containing protein [Patescibacteria group bacterium]